MRTGLVLEGGAMRGLFTAGVLDVLMENEISFDGVVGVSAGAAFGCNYKSRQPGRAIRYNVDYANDRRYYSLWSWLTTGDLFNAKFAYHTLPDELDPFDNKIFEQNPMEFHLVVTDVQTGKPVYRKMEKGGEELYEWLRASASMPIMSKVVCLDGYQLLDGGIGDSIPLKYFQQQGYERNLVILTQPVGFKKKPMKMMRIIRFLLRRYPKLIEAWAHRHEMYNEELRYVEQEEAKGKTLVICPETVLPIGRISHDREKMRATYQLGREAALKNLNSISSFLGI